jgi:8-oxo-dGTP diphosphatase
MSKITPAGEQIDSRRGIDHIGVTVCFVVHDGKGNILMQKRSKNTRDEQLKWDIGGGALEFGETIDEAVKREVKEELCADVTNIQFLITFDAIRQNDDKLTHWIALTHAVQVDPKQVKIGEPHKIDEIGWFKANNLPSPRHTQMDRSMAAAVEAGIV